MPRAAPLPLVTVAGEPSWRFASDHVEAFLTRDGGHLAPVTFQTDVGSVQPFSIAPWCGENPNPAAASGIDRVLRMLRGDFFCAPFGAGKPCNGERHPTHGEAVSARWIRPVLRDTGGVVTEFSASLETRVRPGRIIKRLQLRKSETNLYCRHEFHGYTGPMTFGHHAMLAFPDEAGAGRISLSPWSHGRVFPAPFEDAAKGGYSSLKPGASFRDLGHVPLAAGGFADLTRYPAREGYEDIVMVSARRSKRPVSPTPLAWTAATFPGQRYVWFALKDPRTLASTVLWHSNGGRHYSPWNGRHRRVLGLEEITGAFHLGLADSVAPNPLSRTGIPTTLELNPARPLIVNYLMAVAAIPRGFDVVKTTSFQRDHVVLHAASGRTVEHAVDLAHFQPTDFTS